MMSSEEIEVVALRVVQILDERTKPKAKATSRRLSVQEQDAMNNRIFVHWRNHWGEQNPGAILTPGDKKAIASALFAGYCEQDLLRAIEGLKADTWVRDSGRQRLELLLWIDASRKINKVAEGITYYFKRQQAAERAERSGTFASATFASVPVTSANKQGASDRLTEQQKQERRILAGLTRKSLHYSTEALDF